MEPPGGGANLGWRLLGGKTGWKRERHTVEGRERASRPPPFCVSPRYCRRRHGCALFDLTVPLLSSTFKHSRGVVRLTTDHRLIPPELSSKIVRITVITDSVTL